MPEDILAMLNASRKTVDAFTPTVKDAIRGQIQFIELILMEVLIDDFTEAMLEIPEYSNDNAEPLREHLIANLSLMNGERPMHVQLHENGEPKILFDPVVAGTAADFQRGKHVSIKNANNPELRYIFWKYGIYKPDVEGDRSVTNKAWMARAMDNLPSYDQIIQERLSAWGQTAPYWYFIDRGTAGGGRPYPSFPGTDVVKDFRRRARQAVKDYIRGYIDELEKAVIEAIDRSITEGTPKPVLRPEDIRKRFLDKSGNEIWKNAKGQFTYKPRGR